MIETEFRWPDRVDWALAVVLTLAVFALDTTVGLAIGRSQSLVYDGLGYAAFARVKFFQCGRLLYDPAHYLKDFLQFIAPLWAAVIMLGYALAGAGELQANLARFWPLLGLLLLVIWIARRLATARVAVLLASVTALLPFASPNLALAVRYQLGLDWRRPMRAADWADLRPDLLAHVFMLWAVVPLVAQGRQVGRRTVLLSAVMTSASVLTKGIMAPVAVGAWAVAMAWVAWHQGVRPRRALVGALSVGGIFLALLGPWVIAGGAHEVLRYVRDAYAWRPVYAHSSTDEIGR